MKLIRNLFLVASAMPLFTACLGDSSYGTGFSTVQSTQTAFYANQRHGSAYFSSLGSWTMSQSSGTEWCKPQLTKGEAGAYVVVFNMADNNAGSRRSATFRLQDTSNSDTYSEFTLYQYKSRGDGTLGDAVLVDSVIGSDGSKITLAYDSVFHPTALIMKDGEGKTLQNMTLTYGYNDSNYPLLTIANKMTGATASEKLETADYQPEDIEFSNSNERSRYLQLYYNYTTYSYDQVFRYESTTGSKDSLTIDNWFTTSASNSVSLDPDADHNIIQMIYTHNYNDGSLYADTLNCTYDKNKSNVTQSIDANQLLMGVKECNPYLLLSTFRYARNTNLYSSVDGTYNSYKIESTMENSHLKTLTVTHTNKKSGVVDTPITYTFYTRTPDYRKL
jgi:hypothetical protein